MYRTKTYMITSTRSTLLFMSYNAAPLLWIIHKGNKYSGRRRSSESVWWTLWRQHITHRTYDSPKWTSGEMLCTSLERLSFFALWSKIKLLRRLNYTRFINTRAFIQPSICAISIQINICDELSGEVHYSRIKYECGMFDFGGEMRERVLTLSMMFIWQGCHSRRNLWADL